MSDQRAEDDGTRATVIEFETRVDQRLGEWQVRYDEAGVPCASPLMDRLLAEREIVAEMTAEGRWPGG